jgi:hypothetical protein
MPDHETSSTPKVTVDTSQIASFKTKASGAGRGSAAGSGCTLNPGDHYEEGWQFCWDKQTFECKNGAWVNINKPC